MTIVLNLERLSSHLGIDLNDDAACSTVDIIKYSSLTANDQGNVTHLIRGVKEWEFIC